MLYTCEGFTAMLFVPSPKSQKWLEIFPEDVLLKFTVSGGGPEGGFAVKLALGGA